MANDACLPAALVPRAATDGPEKLRQRALVWRANYHPDGGQLIYSLHGESFVVPLALPGDDVTLEQIVTFWCDLGLTCDLRLATRDLRLTCDSRPATDLRLATCD